MRRWLGVALYGIGLFVMTAGVLGLKHSHRKEFATGSVRFTIPKFGHLEQTPRLASLSAAKRTLPKSADNQTARELVPETITIVKNEQTIKANALPGAKGEEFESSDEHENKRRKKLKAKEKKISENAALLGNNVPLLPGVNPSIASLVPDLDHEGLGGAVLTDDANEGVAGDKDLRKHHKTKSKTHDDGRVPDGDNLVKEIEDITHQLDEGDGTATQSNAVKEDASKASNSSLSSAGSTSDVSLSADEDDDDETSGSGSDQQGSSAHSKLRSGKKEMGSSAWPSSEDDGESKAYGAKVYAAKAYASKVYAAKAYATKAYAAKDAKGASSEAFRAAPQNVLKNSSDEVARGEAGGPEGFECPWVCFWTCHSYCPNECCFNPFHCDTVCRTFCAPTCHDRCCAPGSVRLPSLQLSFQPNTPAPAVEEGLASMDRDHVVALNGDLPGTNPLPSAMERVKAAHDREMEARRFEEINKAREMVGLMSGSPPPSCPLFCTRICAPALCDPSCCEKRISVARADPLPVSALLAEDLDNPSSSRPLQASVMAEVQRAWQTAHDAAALRSLSTLRDTTVTGSTLSTSQTVEPLTTNTAFPASADIRTVASHKIDPDSLAAIVGSPDVAQVFADLSAKPSSPTAIPSAGDVGIELPRTSSDAVSTGLDSRDLAAHSHEISDMLAGSEQLGPLMTNHATPVNPESSENSPGISQTIQSFCPPICRTSCIEECPNLCCSRVDASGGKSA